MTVDITIRVQIDLDEEGVGDPVPGDPLEHRMIAAAQEAVRTPSRSSRTTRGSSMT